MADRMVRKRVSTSRAGGEVETKRQKHDTSSSTETSSRETSTTTTTSTSLKSTSTTTPTSDTCSPPADTGTHSSHAAADDLTANTAADDDVPQSDSTGYQGQGPSAGPPPAALNGAHYYSILLVN